MDSEPAQPEAQPAPIALNAQTEFARNEAGPSKPAAPAQKSGKRPEKPVVPLEPISEVLLRRVTTIREGDNVLLRLPSDSVKAIVASKDG